jgi:NADPH2:quinone reductase
LKAIVCESFGPPESLVLKDAAVPAIKSRHLRARVEYCSVNFPDALMIQGQHQYKREPPFIPGGEISGIVSELGPDTQGFCIGDRVAALTYYGGFAEEAVVPMERVCKLPAALDMAGACCLVGTYGTAIHALAQRAQLCAGETLLVLGAAGGSGAAAVQVGKLMGAHVIAAVGSDAKLEFSLKCGADEGFNYATTPIRDALRALVGQRGVDVIYDPVGGEYSESALRSMAWNGRHLVVGFAAGTIPAFRANLPLLKGCAIIGVFAGEFMTRQPLQAQANTAQLLEWVAGGRLHPAVREIVPIEHTPAALRKLLDREVMGKIVVSIGPAK